MKICKQLCHGKHGTHSVHCDENVKPEPSPKQEMFFNGFRQEGALKEREKIFQKIEEIYKDARPEYFENVKTFLALLKSKL